MTSRHVVLAAVLSATAGTSAAEDWPMWRGPSQNGVSADRRLPLTWSATENVAWKLPLPTVSGSTPIVAGVPLLTFGLVFGVWQWVERMGTLTPTPTGTLLLAALPLVLGFQLLLQAWVMDFANVPSRSRWADRRRDEPAG